MAKKRPATAAAASTDRSAVRDDANDPSRLLADFEATTRAASDCRRLADAMLDAAVLDSPYEAVSMAAQWLYQYQWDFFQLSRRHPPVMDLIASVAEAADVNADYGIGSKATTCHDIALQYANSVLAVLHQYKVGALNAVSVLDLMHQHNVEADEGSVIAFLHQHKGDITNAEHKAIIFPDRLKSEWAQIREELKKLPRIDSKFDGAFQREAARARKEFAGMRPNDVDAGQMRVKAIDTGPTKAQLARVRKAVFSAGKTATYERILAHLKLDNVQGKGLREQTLRSALKIISKERKKA